MTFFRRAPVQLSIVVPVRNEADNILPLLAEIHAALKSIEGKPVEFEVVYVDDGSSDATPQRLAEAMRDYPRLRVLAHRESCGQSTALMTGMRAARGEWVATLDGDGQNDPADIPKLLAARDGARIENLRLVAGYRKKRQDTWLKRVSSRVANGVRSRLLGDATPDTGCGLKLILRSAVLELPVFDHMHRFLPALIQRNGGATLSVEVNHRPRTRGTSNYGMFDRLWVGIVDLFGVMWLQRRTRRPQVRELRRP
ncbi:MAG TPA: glycosyltransferase family 2 protein [Burkholderiales bacterium]|nr:glycosyltransferase family 2 protein [Burkholderiales bacterium]